MGVLIPTSGDYKPSSYYNPQLHPQVSSKNMACQ